MHPDPPDFFTHSKKAQRCHAQLQCQPATRRNMLPIRALRCSRNLVIWPLAGRKNPRTE
jgi:hypothetical protein